MSSFDVILHPTDFTEESEQAFSLACSIARDQFASLVIAHILPAECRPAGAGAARKTGVCLLARRIDLGHGSAGETGREDITVLDEALLEVRAAVGSGTVEVLDVTEAARAALLSEGGFHNTLDPLALPRLFLASKGGADLDIQLAGQYVEDAAGDLAAGARAAHNQLARQGLHVLRQAGVLVAA